MSGFDTTVHVLYLAGAVCFVLGLHLMTSPATARRGNQLSAAGMALAVATTVAVLIHDHVITAIATTVLAVGLAVGGAAGFLTARRVKMTAMPQLVSLFNAVGGGAAALIAFGDAIHHAGSLSLPDLPIRTTLTTFLDLLIGGDHLLRLADRLAASSPGGSRGGRSPSPAAGSSTCCSPWSRSAAVSATRPGTAASRSSVCSTAAALGLGILGTLPIGGADMPVVISLLNAFTGTAVAMAGFVIDSTPLIIAGALVGAAGSILTKLMADAMNRSLVSIIAGGFGTGDEQHGAAGDLRRGRRQ